MEIAGYAVGATDLVVVGFVLVHALVGAWRGVLRPLVGLAAVLAGAASAVALYPVGGVLLVRHAGLGVFLACGIAAGVSFLGAWGIVHLLGRRLVPDPSVERIAEADLAVDPSPDPEVDRAELPTGTYTREDDRTAGGDARARTRPGVLSRAGGLLVGLVAGGVQALLLAGLAVGVVLPLAAPFPVPLDLGEIDPEGRLLEAFDREVWARVDRLPPVDYGWRLAVVRRVVTEVDAAGEEAVEHLGRAPVVRRLLRDPSASSLLERPDVVERATADGPAALLDDPLLADLLERASNRQDLLRLSLPDLLAAARTAIVATRGGEPTPGTPSPSGTPGSGPEPAEPDRLTSPLTRARELAATGDLRAAVEVLDGVESPRAARLRLALLLRTEEVEPARIEEAVRAVDPTSPEGEHARVARALRVVALVRMEAWGRAREEAASIDGGPAEVRLVAAELALAAGRPGRAEELVRDAIAAGGLRGLARARFARLLRRAGLADPARRAFARAARDADELAPSWRAAEGILALEAGDLAVARDRLARALRADPGLPDAHHAIGVLLLEVGAPRPAIEAFLAARALEPAVGLRHRALADALVRTGSPGARELAADLYRRALELDPSDGTAHHHLGMVLELLGDRDEEALAHLRQARAIDDADPGRTHDLGVLLLRRRRFDEAADAFRRAFREAGAPASLVGLALARRGLGDDEGADRVLEEATELGRGDRDLARRVRGIRAGELASLDVSAWAGESREPVDAARLRARLEEPAPPAEAAAYLREVVVRGVTGSVRDLTGRALPAESSPVGATVVDAGAFSPRPRAAATARRRRLLEETLAGRGIALGSAGIPRQAGGAPAPLDGVAEAWRRARLRSLVARAGTGADRPGRVAFRAAPHAACPVSALRPPPLPGPPADPLAGDAGGPPRLVLPVPAAGSGLPPFLHRAELAAAARAALGSVPPELPDVPAEACRRVARSIAAGRARLREGVSPDDVVAEAMVARGAVGPRTEHLARRFLEELPDRIPPAGEPSASADAPDEPEEAPDEPADPVGEGPAEEPDPEPDEEEPDEEPVAEDPGEDPGERPAATAEDGPAADEEDPSEEAGPEATEERPTTPARIVRLHAASNRYALRARETLRPGRAFAFRAVIDLEETAGASHKEVRWRLIGPSGEPVPSFERTDRSPARTGERTAWVEGRVPVDLEPGDHVLEVAVSLPGHAPVVERTPLRVEAVPLLVRRVVVARVADADVGERVYRPGERAFVRAVYEVREPAGSAPRRVAWRVLDADGRPVPSLEGADRSAGSGPGTFAFVREVDLPDDLEEGTYRVVVTVEVGEERTTAHRDVVVRSR